MGSGCFGLALWLVVVLHAGVAGAVEVVDVRIGEHAKFTRLVFELDAPAAYRITRTQAAGGKELRIAFQAQAQPSKFFFKAGRVESLDVRAKADTALVIVGLRDEQARFSEMTLTKPYRVVIDVLSPAGIASAAAARPQKGEQKSKAAKTTAAVRPTAVARTPVPALKPTKLAKAVETVAKAPPIAEARVPAEPVSAALPRDAKSAETTSSAALPAQRIEDGDRPLAPPWAWAALGGLVLLVAGLMVARRRRRAFDRDAGVLVPVDAGASPFEGLVPEVRAKVDPGVEARPDAAAKHEAEAKHEAQTETREVASRRHGVEAEVAGNDGREPVVEGEDFALVEAGATEASTALATEGLHPILERIEARLLSMEARLEDFEAGTSGFEKQVDTHTEELRVQRAAIARTQRALRQISRPRDAEVSGSESVAPTGTRVGRRDADGEH
ncbi:MAG: hypothetical protein VCC02_06780 [Myxococcota bacterium]